MQRIKSIRSLYAYLTEFSLSAFIIRMGMQYIIDVDVYRGNSGSDKYYLYAIVNITLYTHLTTEISGIRLNRDTELQGWGLSINDVTHF